MARPKASFRLRLREDEFLSVSVFPTKRDPTAEVISIQVQKPPRDNMKTGKPLGELPFIDRLKGIIVNFQNMKNQHDISRIKVGKK